MPYTKFIKFITSYTILIFSISLSFAQGQSLEDIVRDIKKGSEAEKLSAAKLIVDYGSNGEEAERSLRKLVEKEKNPKNAVTYLSALLAVSEDHASAYRRFIKNGKKQSGKKHEKARKITAFFSELGSVSPVPNSLLPFIISLRNEKDVTDTAVNNALALLANNNTEYLPEIVNLMDEDPINTIRVLNNVEVDLETYLPRVIVALEAAPRDGLRLLLKHNKLDEQVVNFAISKAVMPDKSSREYFFSRNGNIWYVALDVLAASEIHSEKARAKLIELLNSPANGDVQKAIAKIPQISEQLQAEKTTSLFGQLAKSKDTGNQNVNAKYDLCINISNLKINDPSQIKTLINAAKFSNDATIRMGCTYALIAAETLTNEAIAYLVSSLDSDINRVKSKSEDLLGSINSSKNRMVTTQFQSSYAPDLKALYAAHVLLKHVPDHLEAGTYVEQLYNANIEFLEFDRNNEYMRAEATIYPTAMAENGNFKGLFAEKTPFETMAYKYSNNNSALVSHVESGILSSNFTRAFNAARFAVENNIQLSDAAMQRVLDIIVEEDRRAQSVAFILALENAEKDSAMMATLDRLAKEKYLIRKNAANKVLTAIAE